MLRQYKVAFKKFETIFLKRLTLEQMRVTGCLTMFFHSMISRYDNPYNLCLRETNNSLNLPICLEYSKTQNEKLLHSNPLNAANLFHCKIIKKKIPKVERASLT